MEPDHNLPSVLAGPLLRHVQPDCMMLWLVTTLPVHWHFRLRNGDSTIEDRAVSTSEQTQIQIGNHAYLQLLKLQADASWPPDCLLNYDLGIVNEGTRWIADWAPHLCHEIHTSPHLVIHSRVKRVMHGSCRKPHHDSDDALCRVDEEISLCGTQEGQRPSLMLMTGDQVYVDDVAGPMLTAIHQLSEKLSLFDEVISEAKIENGKELLKHEHTYYKRSHLLPFTKENAGVIDRFFGGARKPIFTTANAENHLVSLAEVLAMYLLVWSPVPWTLIERDEPSLPAGLLKRYRKESDQISSFVDSLPKAARALCHVPCYMIFDDHDVSDDWNLSLSWERTVYNNRFSRRIVGNALIAYTLCQGWGNNAEHLSDITDECKALLHDATSKKQTLQAVQHDALIDRLLAYRGWQFSLNTSPAVVVLDTRTHRWHHRSKPSKPSGLMDWEALTDFQQIVMDKPSVIVVSPAPLFGVKLIEIVQSIFTFFGKPLLVDAENWMAHHEAATIMLSIFEHRRTPQNFVLLSGDVHYSFAYDVRLRYQSETPAIWQITSSGIKNEFPAVLIEWLDRLNRWLFAPWSPLNFLTQRRAFRIWPRLPEGRSAGERLWNSSGIGDLHIDAEGRPVTINQLNSIAGGTRFMENSEEV